MGHAVALIGEMHIDLSKYNDRWYSNNYEACLIRAYLL